MGIAIRNGSEQNAFGKFLAQTRREKLWFWFECFLDKKSRRQGQLQSASYRRYCHWRR